MRQSIKKNINRLIIFIITLATSFAATTAYINGIDEDYGSATTIRNDVVLLGSVAGGFDGMNVPTGQVNSTTTIYNLMLVDASGGNPIANNNSTNSSGTGNGVFSNNLTDLWITGNASNFATYVTSA